MSFIKKHKLTLVTIAYWFLLLYILAALLWWFIALNNQLQSMTDTKLSEINKDDIAYIQKTSAIQDLHNRKTAQYIGEGITFLVIILIGAVFIYRATRKQIKFGQQQQNFMMAITHELKTPIATTKINLETIKKRNLNSEQHSQMIDGSINEIERLNSLCNNILWAAQLEGGVFAKSNENINLSELAKKTVERYATFYGLEKIKFNIEETILINGDTFMLEMLMNNLVENAIKYSPKNESVEIALLKKNGIIVLQVKDKGIGINENERKKIFEKFYRIGNESVRKTKGTGLGLYLSKKICNYHNADISVTNNENIGSIFTVIFK